MNKKILEEIIKNSYSIREVLTKLGKPNSGGAAYKKIYREIEKFQINTEHFKRPVTSPDGIRKAIPLDKILIKNSKYSNTNRLKKRLIKADLLKERCYICKINQWLNKPIVLQLDHINGINNDNRIENLRLLCPNCHSQTETFAGKNAKTKTSKPRPTKIQWPEIKELTNMVERYGYSEIGRRLGVSGNAVKKRIKSRCPKNRT